MWVLKRFSDQVREVKWDHENIQLIQKKAEIEKMGNKIIDEGQIET